MNILNLSPETLLTMLSASRRPDLFHSMFANALEMLEEGRYLGLPEGEEPGPETQEFKMRKEVLAELAQFYHVLEQLEEQIEDNLVETDLSGDVDLTEN